MSSLRAKRSNLDVGKVRLLRRFASRKDLDGALSNDSRGFRFLRSRGFARAHSGTRHTTLLEDVPGEYHAGEGRHQEMGSKPARFRQLLLQVSPRPAAPLVPGLRRGDDKRAVRLATGAGADQDVCRPRNDIVTYLPGLYPPYNPTRGRVGHRTSVAHEMS